MIPHKKYSFTLFLLAAAILLLAGCSRTDTSSPPAASTPATAAPGGAMAAAATTKPSPTLTATAAATATPTATPAASGLAIYCDPHLPPAWRKTLQKALQQQPVLCVEDRSAARIHLALQPLAAAPEPILARRFYAAVVPFATVRDDISLAELQARWLGHGGPLLVSEDAAGPLFSIFGAAPAHTTASAQFSADLLAREDAVGLMPFDQLDPSYKVLTIDGVNLLDKRIEPAAYPLAVALTLGGPDAKQALPFLQDVIQPATNRDVARMTTLIMTGVTAMSRGTAEKMEQKGYLYPALVISDTLSAADITHVSNEVPFIKGCPVNNTYMNLVLCSDYPYWQALAAIGTDIVGLSGNHVNDFGREGARESLGFYARHHIPIYGSGLDEEAACQPLMWESNGNSYAFFAALAWWPEEAWATATQPGACYYYRNRRRLMQRISELSQQVDIVSVELQFEETYNPWPVRDQVAEFRALRQAGADIVTGVQSHVPQAAEPYSARQPGGPGIILYGLGNLFFDQMQSWETRTALIPRHTIYQGRLLSTELLTTVLEDFAQPRWATPDERAQILKSIFAAAPPRQGLPASTPPVSQPHTLTPTPTLTPVAPTPSSTPTAPAPEPVATLPPAAASAATVHPQPTPPPANIAFLPWPTPQAQSQPHFLLARPTAPEANRMEDLGYPFGGTASNRYRVHHGVDIANPAGAPLLAPANARILYAGPDDAAHIYGPYPDFYGNVVIFQLDQSWQGHTVYVLYGHLQKVEATTGQHVDSGQQVGLTGMTGIALGPHVHVELRLDAPDDYNAVYNPALWLQPFAGYGVIAGRVVTPDGRAWHGLRLHAYRLASDGVRLYRVFGTYAMDAGLHPDPELAENGVLGSVPAGDYEIVLKLNGKDYRQRLHVAPGQIGSFQFVVDDK